MYILRQDSDLRQDINPVLKLKVKRQDNGKS